MTLKIIRPKQITGTDFLTAIAMGIALGVAIYLEQGNGTNKKIKEPKSGL